MPDGALARLDQMVEFRNPLGPAAKHFLSRLSAAYLVENAEIAERMAHEQPQGYFLTPEGTCYHGRLVSGGRQGEAGPLALKREFASMNQTRRGSKRSPRSSKLKWRALKKQSHRASTIWRPRGRNMWKRKNPLVTATHQRDQVQAEFRRTRAADWKPRRREIARLHARSGSGAGASRSRAECTCPGAEPPRHSGDRSGGSGREALASCGTIFRRCKSAWWLGAKSWPPCRSDWRAPKPSRNASQMN